MKNYKPVLGKTGVGLAAPVKDLKRSHTLMKEMKLKEEKMAVISINQNNFKEEVQAQQGIMLLDFWATWCGPCSMIAPIVDQVAEEENIKVGKINIDEERNLAYQFEIEAIPTIILMKDGKEINRQVGFMDKNELKAFLQK